MRNETVLDRGDDSVERPKGRAKVLSRPREKDEGERIVVALNMMLRRAEESILKSCAKETSISDYQRLLQLRREHGTAAIREIEVRWIDPATMELSGLE